jgi:ABC-type bacteriocin/lantibiotic exporter with double-glycine peptidase domain
MAVPMPIILIVIAILNYELGSKISEMNSVFSSINDITKEQFFNALLKADIIWGLLFIANNLITKVSNLKMLNKNYMKWIERLTYSKVSSITNIGTGGIANSINTISNCDKDMINTVIATLPFIMPAMVICVKEYKTAGILPVIIDIVYVIAMIVANCIAANMKSNKISAKANAKMRSTTTDCIYNSKTVKYFNKEKWSIERQRDMQKNTYYDMLNLKKRALSYSAFGLLQWIPTVVNSFLCWNDISTVLYITMTDYVLSNIVSNTMSFLDLYSERKANLELLGNLQEDNQRKKNIEDFRIDGVEFKYSDESKVTFKIDNIVIKKGHRYCITGTSGFGKSTFIKILTKTVEVTNGCVEPIDCIYMFAESEMFNDTILENISLGDDTVTEDEVKDILDNLQVNIDIDIARDFIGEKGESLSTGQRQRINLARVITYARRNPNTLIALDEVTSALDEETSIHCIKYITEEFKKLNTTVLYVSNKSDYKDTDLITDNIYVEKSDNEVRYIQK